MTLLLSIETATDVCGVAVSRDGLVVAEAFIDEPRRHSERLVPMIDEAMTLAGCMPTGLTAIAVSAGPGSYTGLRIGASTAKGLAFALGIPLIPVPSLQALASSIDAPPGSLVIAAFGARRGEVYAAAFRFDASPLSPMVGATIADDPELALRTLWTPADEAVFLVGDGAPLMANAAAAASISFRMCPDIRPTAGGIARAATELLRRGAPVGASVDADAFEPYYLREFTARPASRSIFERLQT